MDWLKRLFSKRSKPEKTEIKPELSANEVDLIAMRSDMQIQTPEIRLDTIPPEVIEEIAALAASHVKLPAAPEIQLDTIPPEVIDVIAAVAASQVKVPAVPEIRLDTIPSAVIDEIAQLAASRVKVPAAPEKEIPATVIEEIARQASLMVKLPPPQEAIVNFDKMPPRVMDDIARRVASHLSAKVVQEIAWEVVPDLAELLIRKYLVEGRLIAPPSPAVAKAPAVNTQTEGTQRVEDSAALSKTVRPPSPEKDPLDLSSSPAVESVITEPKTTPPAVVSPDQPVSLTPNEASIVDGHTAAGPVTKKTKGPASVPSKPASVPSKSTEPGPPLRSRRPEADLPVSVGDDAEKPFHYDARRYARLLVSELSLYNEQKVKLGKENSSLYKLLREEIVKSRDAYAKRVKPPVAAQYDYFHDELVKGLAGGDQAKLGMDYPGPM